MEQLELILAIVTPLILLNMTLIISTMVKVARAEIWIKVLLIKMGLDPNKAKDYLSQNGSSSPG